MKTLEQLKELASKCLDGRDFNRLAKFIPYNMIKDFGMEPNEEYNNEERWNSTVVEFTRENVLKQLEEDVRFGFEKALNQRGISASLMFECVMMWNYILEEGLEDWDEDDYGFYGLPLFKATAVKYGWDNPIGEDSGRERNIALSDLESQIREVLKRCLSYKIVEEVPVIKYQLETNCTFSYDKNGNIVPNPSKEWTGGDENGKWRDGTSRLDALNTQPFGFSVYAKPFLKRVIEYGNGETKVEYGRLNTEKGTYAHWLNCVTSISYNRYKQVMEVECNECTSKLFVDIIKSICKISEQVKGFINPEQIKAIAESNEPILLLSNN